MSLFNKGRCSPAAWLLLRWSLMGPAAVDPDGSDDPQPRLPPGRRPWALHDSAQTDRKGNVMGFLPPPPRFLKDKIPKRQQEITSHFILF